MNKHMYKFGVRKGGQVTYGNSACKYLNSEDD